MSAQSSINLLQNITIVPSSSCTSSSTKVRKMTSSMYFFGEEPAFSDSDTELEMVLDTPTEAEIVVETLKETDKVFKTPKETDVVFKIPKETKSHVKDVGIQCEMLTEEKTLIWLIKNAANLDCSGDYAELIALCKKINTSSSVLNDGDNCSNDGVVDEYLHPDDFSLSRHGRTRRSKVVSKIPKRLASTSICTKKRKPPIKKSRKKLLTKNDIKQIYETKSENEDTVLSKKRSHHSKEDSENLNSEEKCVSGIDSGRMKRKSHLQRISSNPKMCDVNFVRMRNQLITGSDSWLEGDKKTEHTFLAPSSVNIKSLARNWLKPNKSVSNLDEHCVEDRGYVSLPTRLNCRKLYSPSLWVGKEIMRD